LALIEQYVVLNKSKYADLKEKLTGFLSSSKWAKSDVSEILKSNFLNDDEKVEFLKSAKIKNRRSSIYFEVFNTTINTIINPENEEQPMEMVNDDLSLDKYKKIIDREEFTDCEFLFPNGGSLKAHKVFLSVASPVFETMFSGKIQKDVKIEIEESKGTFELLLR